MSKFEAQIHAAKAYLLQTSVDSSSNLYDHLSECLSKILDERPQNAVDVFERVSESVKKEKFQPKKDTLQDQEGPSAKAKVAELQKPLFEKTAADQDVEGEEEVAIPFPDLMDNARYFEQGRIGLGQEETFRIFLALKKLTQEFPLASARFWGKIFGTEADYIVAEAEYQEGEGEEEEEGGGDGGEEGGGNEGGDDGEDEEEKDEPPKSQWKAPPTVPKEEAKTGANKKTYFVCNQPGEKWVKLPHVSPAHIAVSRQIRRLLTGRLESPVVTYPPFPGKEENYLRAQIARISATTQVSPNGFYRAEEDEEDGGDEEEGGPTVLEPDPEFEIGNISEFADPSNWVHHVSYILPQGRVSWWNPVQKADNEFEDDEEEDEDEREQPDEPEPETGPNMLTSISEDTKVDDMPAWSVHLSSPLLPQYAVAIASSNLWPGAHAFTAPKAKFENIYIGWGLKYSSSTFNPALPPPVQEEFPAGPDIKETTDPTVEQERALKVAQEEAEANEAEEEEPEESDED